MVEVSVKVAGSLNRRSFIGGSDARIIMGDDENALFRLWQEKRGEVEPEDLSGNLIVQLGLVTEPLNRHWYERNSGQAIKECSAGCGTPWCGGWRRRLMGLWTAPERCSKPNSCCRGHSRRKSLPKSTWRSSST